jgi:hypothetical protein
MGPHRSVCASGQRTRVSNVAASHIRDYPDADSTDDDTPTTVIEARVPKDQAGRASFAVAARKSTGEVWSAVLDAHVENDDDTVTILHQESSVLDPDELGYSATIAVSGTDLQVQVTGGATDDVKWACVPELLLVAL